MVQDLGCEVGDEEGDPAVGAGWAFADFVESALGDELGEDLVDSFSGGINKRVWSDTDLLHERCEDRCDHEDGKERVLKSSLRGILVVERETSKQGRHNSEHQLSEHISRRPIVLLEGTLCDVNDLRGQWESISRSMGLPGGDFFIGCREHSIKLGMHFNLLLTRIPHLRPVDLRICASA